MGSMMIILLIFSILLYLIAVGKRSIRWFFIKIRTMQLIIHLPMIKIILAGNIMAMFENLIPLMQFDVLEFILDWEEQTVLSFDFDRLEEM